MSLLDTLLTGNLQSWLLYLAALFIGLSKGGLPAIAMLSVPILSLYMSPIAAAALLLPIYIASDIVGVWLYRREFSAPNLKILIPAGLLGVCIGWLTATVISDQMVSMLIGIIGIVFCLNMWLKRGDTTTPKPVSIKKGLFWGTLSGFTSFVSHAGAPPYQVYMLPQKLPKMVFAGTTTIVFAMNNLAKVLPYSQLQPYDSDTIKTSVLLLPIALAGTFLGRYLTLRLSEKWFYLLVQFALFSISIRLVYHAWP